MTYYKYVKRDLDDQVNWADLSKQLTEKLNQEVKVREEKKAQFDKEFRDLNNKIAEKPIGTSAAANKMALRIGDAAAQQNLMLYKKLKAGEIRPRDYVMLRQNINDSVDSYYNSLKQWQEVSKTKMDRNSKGDSSGFELKKMAELESYGDFDNVSPIFTDEGRLVLAKQTTDPETGEVKMGEVKPIDQILVDMNSYYDKFPVNEVMDKWVKSLGKYGKYVKDADGNTKLVVDANQRPIFEKASNDQIEAFVNSDPYNTLSILEDSIGFIDGKDIEYTYDKNKAGGNVILLERNPNDPNKRDIPRLDDNQRKVVIDWAKNQLQTKLEYSESGLIRAEKATPRQATEGELKRADTRKQQANKSNMIAKLYSGDNTEVASAVNFFTGAENVRKVNRTPSGVDVTMVDSKGNEITKSLPFYADGNLIPASDWISGASRLLIGEDADPEIAKRTAIQTKGSAFNQTYTASSEAKTDQTTTEDPVEVYGSFVKNNITKLGIGTDTEEKVADNITQQFSKFGFSAEVPWTYGNFIRIKSPNGEVSAEINLDKPSSAQNQIMQFLIQNTEGADAKEKFINLTNLIQSGVIESSGAGGPDYGSK